MRKIPLKLFLIFLFIASISCSKSDIRYTSNDPIVGRWKYQTQFVDGIETPTIDCAPGIIEFSRDGKKTEHRFDYVGANDCIESVFYSRWQKYSLDYRIYDNAGVLLNTAINFEDNNSVMTATTYTIDDNPLNPHIVATKLVYNKF